MTENEKFLLEEMERTKQNIQNLSNDGLLDAFFWARLERKAYWDRDDSIPWTQTGEDIVCARVRVIKNEILRRMNTED